MRRSPRRLVAPLLLALFGGLGFLWWLPREEVALDSRAASRAEVPSARPASAAPPPLHVTRSLSELGLSRVALAARGLSDFALLFNTIPASGSEPLLLLLRWLQASNGFRLLPLLPLQQRGDRLSPTAQEGLVTHVTDALRREALPVAFHGAVFFTNFTTYDRQTPTYINLMRDPVDRALARLSSARTAPAEASAALRRCVHSSDCDPLNGDLAIPYFCGHDTRCGIPQNRWALQEAKANIERYFPVVGVLEELNATLEVLEMRLPLFFAGAKDLFSDQLSGSHMKWNKRSQDLKPEVRRKVEKRLALEYELYIWAKLRLMNQYTEDLKKAPIPAEAGQDRIAHSIHKRAHLENEKRKRLYS